MALDEATSAFLAQMAESGGKALHEMTPEEARGLGAMLRGLYGAGPQMKQVRDLQVPVDGGEIAVRVLTPVEDPRGVLVYYHGGGWVIGAIDEFDTLGRILAERTGFTTVLVDYRLAPEHRYPVAVDDSWAALQWVAANRAALAPNGPLVIAGDSAGGNLSAIMAQRAKAAGGPAIDLQVLVYPVTDADFDNETYVDPENQLMLTRDAMIWFWDHYVPDPAARAEPDASPITAEDLSGLPPAVVLTAEHDVLREEGEAYARRLAWAGVPVQHRRFEGQMHGFFTMVNVLPGSAAGIDYVVAAIDELAAAQA
ncbi:acetyl esterase [Pseudonocardia thermophila]|jgi:Esterase/lipase|uniref:Acetyl esterase n=1 Tax=Pseudonocardia thermophila TaxID=1848 RepID=A0A1M6ZBU1_PSETH|nr:alpha/beta hydrolase [Pseudonocardia thermophila]SHL27971.1 acetyl esterase [Pseudonocardia thermophila]